MLGGGATARLVLEHGRRVGLRGVEMVGIAGRGPASRGVGLAAEFGLKHAPDRAALLALRPQVVVEAASLDAVREHLVELLRGGVGVVELSAGALADDALRREAQAAAEASGALLYVPSGGIGGLDAFKTACLAGVDEASIQVAKPPAAWKGNSLCGGEGFSPRGTPKAAQPFRRLRRRRGAAFSAKRKHRRGPWRSAESASTARGSKWWQIRPSP